MVSCSSPHSSAVFLDVVRDCVGCINFHKIKSKVRVIHMNSNSTVFPGGLYPYLMGLDVSS